MSDHFPGEPAEPPRALVAALNRILRPLVRLLLRHGITFPALSRLLKSVYVEVAQGHFALEGRRLSDSRISLLTGVHRKDVRALRDQHRDDTEAPETVSLGSQIIARWITEPRYLRDGKPRVLPRRASRGPSFDALVESVARKDLKPRVVLDELLRVGVVEMTSDGEVALKLEAFVPQRGFDEKAFYLGRNVADHLSASVNNLEREEPPFLERAVSYHQLSESDVSTLQARCEELAMDALKDVNRRAMSARKRGTGRVGANRRFSFGIYFYTEAEEQPPQDGR